MKRQPSIPVLAIAIGVVALAGRLVPAGAATRGDEREMGPDMRARHMTAALESIEGARQHLDALGWEKAHGMLGRIADELRQGLRGLRRESAHPRQRRGPEEPERLLHELHGSLEEIQGEIAAIEDEMQQLRQHREVTERVLEELTHEARGADEPEARERAARLRDAHARRLDRSARHLHTLEIQLERTRVMHDRLEQQLELVRPELKAMEIERHLEAREARIRALGERARHLLERVEARAPERPDARERERPERREPAERRGRGDREIVERRIEVMRLALPALREAERRDAADRLERAIVAHEVMLEGRRDEEAQEIRRRAPKDGAIVELLVLAERLYREFDVPDRADEVSRLTEELWPRPRER